MQPGSIRCPPGLLAFKPALGAHHACLGLQQTRDGWASPSLVGKESQRHLEEINQKLHPAGGFRRRNRGCEMWGWKEHLSNQFLQQQKSNGVLKFQALELVSALNIEHKCFDCFLMMLTAGNVTAISSFHYCNDSLGGPDLERFLRILISSWNKIPSPNI